MYSTCAVWVCNSTDYGVHVVLYYVRTLNQEPRHWVCLAMIDREVTRVVVSSSRYTSTDDANVPKCTSGVWDRSEEAWIRISVREWRIPCATKQEVTKWRNWQDSFGTVWVRVTGTCIQSGGINPTNVRGHKLWWRASLITTTTPVLCLINKADKVVHVVRMIRDHNRSSTG